MEINRPGRSVIVTIHLLHDSANLCVQEGPPCVLNVFQTELMSPTRSERCARCMCHVCTYKPAPLVVLLATVVTHSEPVLPGGVSYMHMYVQCTDS